MGFFSKSPDLHVLGVGRSVDEEDMLLTLCSASVVAVLTKSKSKSYTVQISLMGYMCTGNGQRLVRKRPQRKRKNAKLGLRREWLGNRTTFGAHYTLLAGGTQKVNLDVATNRDLLVVPSIKCDNHCQHVIFYVSVFVKRHLVERNRARLYSVQQSSTC